MEPVPPPVVLPPPPAPVIPPPRRLPHPRKYPLTIIGGVLGIVLIATGIIFGYPLVKSRLQPSPKPTSPGSTTSLPQSANLSYEASAFAAYKAPSIVVKPALPTSTIAAKDLVNLSAIETAEKNPFTDNQKNALTTKQFVTRPVDLNYDQDPQTPSGRVDDMVQIYSRFEGSSEPAYRKPENAVFITTDYLLHLYHRFIDKAFQHIEETKFHPELQTLSHTLANKALASAGQTADPVLKQSLERVAAYFLVPAAILDASQPKLDSFEPDALEQAANTDDTADTLTVAQSKLASYRSKLPAALMAKVDQELALIYLAKSMAGSPLYDEFRSQAGLSNPEDYTQYGPRSHYTKNSLLRSYFRAMMWFGRQGFAAKSPELTRQALIINWLMAAPGTTPSLLSQWESIYQPTVFFVGKSDDLTLYEYGAVMKVVYGDNINLASLADQAKFLEFNQKIDALRPPAIMGDAFIGGAVLDKTKAELQAETKGFRFMGQRFIPDSFMFSELTQGDEKADPETGQSLPSTPTALMIMLLLDSTPANTELPAWIAANAPRSDKVIAKTMGRLHAQFAKLDEPAWTQNIYWTWLYTLKSLFAPVPTGYPGFMRSPDWGYKSLNTGLGSWTELRHDTLLYAKQSYAEMGGGPPDLPTPPPVPKGYVEPNPAFFERLIGLTDMTNQGLSSRQLIDETLSGRLTGFHESLSYLTGLVVKELQNETISEDEYERLRHISGELANVIAPFSGEITTEHEARSGIIADVHTDVPKGQILYEATGKPQAIYVAIKDAGGARLTRGVVYSYYEFAHPLGERLTDETWQSWVYENKAAVPSAVSWVTHVE